MITIHSFKKYITIVFLFFGLLNELFAIVDIVVVDVDDVDDYDDNDEYFAISFFFD